MALKGEAKESLRNEVAGLNQAMDCDLSYKKLYSDVKKIMSKDAARQPELFVAYYRELTKEIYENVAYKRTLAFTDYQWNKFMRTYGQFSLGEAASRARSIVNYCRRLIDPTATNTVELGPEQLKSLKDWQLEELNTYTEYAENVKILGEWTNETVDKHLSEEEARLGTNSDDPNRVHIFRGNFKSGNDAVVANVYKKMFVIQEELDSHIFLWKWFHSDRVEAYNNFITRAKVLLEKVGFDEEQYGADIIAHAKSTKFEPYDKDVEIVNMNYDMAMERYEEKQIEELHIARNYREWVDELNLDPDSSYASKLASYAEKYDMKVSDLNRGQMDWKAAARDYDTRRDTETMISYAERTFMVSFTGILEHSIRTGRDINVADILQDARNIAVTSLRFNSIAYDLDKFKDAKCPIYMMNDLSPEFVEERLKTFYLKNLKNVSGEKLSEERINEISRAAYDVLHNWKENAEQIHQEDLEFAKQHVLPERTLFSPIEVKIANSLMTVGYRPPSADDPNMLKKHNTVLNKILNNSFGEGKLNSNEVKMVLANSANKLSGMSKLVFDKMGDEQALNSAWEEADRKLGEAIPEYMPKTLADLDNNPDRVKESIILDDNSVSEIEPMKEDDSKNKDIVANV